VAYEKMLSFIVRDFRRLGNICTQPKSLKYLSLNSEEKQLKKGAEAHHEHHRQHKIEFKNKKIASVLCGLYISLP